MLRVCEKLREVDAKAKRLGLARTETDYLRALLDAMADMDGLMEVEVLKSLGDVNMETGKLRRDAVKLDRAVVLYRTALLRCEDVEIRESLNDRNKYAEKLREGKVAITTAHNTILNVSKELSLEARVAQKFLSLDRNKDYSNGSLLIEYTKLMIEGIVNEDNILETEAIKSLGDVYLKRGTKTRDPTLLTKATALYNTALARCERLQGTVALIHRLLYTARIRQDMANKVPNRRGQQYRSPPSRDPPGTSANSDVIVDTRRQQLKLYEEHLATGGRALADGNLDLAEQKFASALKLIHDRNKPDQRKEADCLCRLGGVYVQQGIRTKEGRRFTQAAALYNSALARAKEDENKVMKSLRDTEKLFLQFTVNVANEPSLSDLAIRHKKRLEDMRARARSRLEAIDQQHNPYQYDEDDPAMITVEAERAKAVKALCKSIAKDRQVFIKDLVDECIGTLGPPPCKYAFIGLGSQATEMVTPYSDLEFTILIEDGKDNDDTRQYFLNLTHYLHLKVINLRETILPAMAIPSLNDFQSEDPEKDWFFDSFTPHGFAFDGFMPWASKTPFGRDKTKTKPPISLIQTPTEMTKFQHLDVSLSEGYHLSDMLRRFVFLAGDKALVSEYMELLMEVITDDLLSHFKSRRLLVFGMQHILESMGHSHTTFEPTGQLLSISQKDIANIGQIFSFEPTGQMLNVKKDIYRFPGIVIDLLAVFCNITLLASTWDVIDEMKKAGWIHEEDAKHLTILTSISGELRLRTYMAKGGQQDSLSPLAEYHTKTEEVSDTTLKSAFHIPDTKVLFRYYCRAIPLRMCIPDMIRGRKLQGQPGRVFETAIFDTSNECMGRIAANFCLFNKSIHLLEAALGDVGSNKEKHAQILNDLGLSWAGLGDHKTASSYHQKSLMMYKTIQGKCPAHSGTVKSLHNLGLAHSKVGDYKEAISCYDQALAMIKTVSGDDMTHNDVAACLNSLGSSWRRLGDHKKAISYYEQFLEMTETLVGKNNVHPDIAGALNNLGICWHELGDHNKAVRYWEKSLAMTKAIYGHNTAHPDIAMSLTNLGSAYRELGDQEKAVSVLEQALTLLKTIHGEMHPHIARTLLNLGTSWCRHGNSEKAINYCQQSLLMRRTIYGDNTPHPDIATSLHNLGSSWSAFGDHKKAVSYFEQALTMRKKIFGDKAHPDIAKSHHSLGLCWSALRDEKKAITHYNRSLRMMETVYGA
ncbi:hypothetical protein Bbelb_355150 [Branchiostoma belcheri]|nr:hypothetical protein Bbelb_355150 [Branchiostoma belcheri]